MSRLHELFRRNNGQKGQEGVKRWVDTIKDVEGYFDEWEQSPRRNPVWFDCMDMNPYLSNHVL